MFIAGYAKVKESLTYPCPTPGCKVTVIAWVGYGVDPDQVPRSPCFECGKKKKKKPDEGEVTKEE